MGKPSDVAASEPLSLWRPALGLWTKILVATVFPLIWVGGLVTTTDAGMAVPDWPNTYGYNLFLYPVYDWFFGPWDLFVEHGHRLLGALAGVVSMVVAALAWRLRATRPVVARVAILALVLVIAQGILGGLRVVFDQRALAMIHGCLGPTYFVVVVALATATSRWWCIPRIVEDREAIPAGLACHLLAGSLVQLYLGANLRHVPVAAPPWFFNWTLYMHLGLAGLLLVGSAILHWRCRKERIRSTALRPWSGLALAALCAQLFLGAGTWIVNYAWPSILGETAWTGGYVIGQKSFWQTTIVTAHVAMGSAIAGLFAATAFRTFRMKQPIAGDAKSPLKVPHSQEAGTAGLPAFGRSKSAAGG